MSKCKYCGSEYYSEGDRCYACARSDESIDGNTPYERRLWRSVLASVFLIVIGAGIAIAGGSIAGLVLVTTGVGGVVYSFVGIEQPLWMTRDGVESRNSLAVLFLVFGAMTITFELGCAIPSRHESLPKFSIPAYLMMTSISVILMAAGYYIRPSFLLAVDAFQEVPKKKREFVARMLLTSGVALQVAALTYGILRPYEANAFLILYSIITGMVFEVAGIGEFSPSGRWWVDEGGLK